MWVWSVVPPSKAMRRCLPCASTEVTSSPGRGRRAAAARGARPAVRLAGRDRSSKRTTRRPVRSRSRARAARKIVSPSGIVRSAAKHEAAIGVGEAGGPQGAGPGRFPGRTAVDADEFELAGEPVLHDGHEPVDPRRVAPGGREGDEAAAAPLEVGGRLAADYDDVGPGGPGR